MIEIFLNGVSFNITEEKTLADFLEEQGFSNKKIAVEVDGEVVPKSLHPSFLLKAGMKLEIIAFVGGG